MIRKVSFHISLLFFGDSYWFYSYYIYSSDVYCLPGVLIQRPPRHRNGSSEHSSISIQTWKNLSYKIIYLVLIEFIALCNYLKRVNMLITNWILESWEAWSQIQNGIHIWKNQVYQHMFHFHKLLLFAWLHIHRYLHISRHIRLKRSPKEIEFRRMFSFIFFMLFIYWLLPDYTGKQNPLEYSCIFH